MNWIEPLPANDDSSPWETPYFSWDITFDDDDADDDIIETMNHIVEILAQDDNDNENEVQIDPISSATDSNIDCDHVVPELLDARNHDWKLYNTSVIDHDDAAPLLWQVGGGNNTNNYNEKRKHDDYDQTPSVFATSLQLPAMCHASISSSSLAVIPPPPSPPPPPAAKKQRTSFEDCYQTSTAVESTTRQTASRSTSKNSQTESWESRFQDLLHFKRNTGHCMVPYMYPANPLLAQWVKRQRYQHKLRVTGKNSALTDKRLEMLERVGFIWDSHEAAWMERWNQLNLFFIKHGHSDIPTNYTSNRQLSIWVKGQRRQYKLYVSGRPSNMTKERIFELEKLNFNWNPRNL